MYILYIYILYNVACDLRARLCWLNCSFYCILDLFSLFLLNFIRYGTKLKKKIYIFSISIYFCLFFCLRHFSIFLFFRSLGKRRRQISSIFCLFSILKLLWGVQESFVEIEKKNRRKNNRFSCSSMLVEEIPMYYIKLANMSDYTRRDKLPQSGIPYIYL